MSSHRGGMGAKTDPPVPPGVDPAVPSPARLYDYYLGGTANYQSDRMAADRLRELIPELEDTAWANRGFHQRAARQPPLSLAVCRDVYARSLQEIYPRTRAEVVRLFDGLELVPAYRGGEPKVVHVGEWGAR